MFSLEELFCSIDDFCQKFEKNFTRQHNKRYVGHNNCYGIESTKGDFVALTPDF